MKRHKRIPRWPVAVVVGMVTACGYWVLGGGCTTAGVGGGGAGGEDEPEGVEITEASCESLDVETNGFEMTS